VQEKRIEKYPASVRFCEEVLTMVVVKVVGEFFSVDKQGCRIFLVVPSNVVN